MVKSNSLRPGMVGASVRKQNRSPVDRGRSVCFRSIIPVFSAYFKLADRVSGDTSVPSGTAVQIISRKLDTACYA